MIPAHCRRAFLASATLPASLAIATPAQAVIFQYYEGNNCAQTRLGSADVQEKLKSSQNAMSWNLKRDPVPPHGILGIFAPVAQTLADATHNRYNDEIRSVRVTSNWRVVREARAPRFVVHDNPDGKTDDDWARIHVTDATLIPEEGVCIGSFEAPFDRYGIKLERHPVNGLDGKISRLTIECDASCAANLTPDPMRPTRPMINRPVPKAPFPKVKVIGRP